ncbi:hypothetical protein ACS0TY_021474 [Phlomoides rotata]
MARLMKMTSVYDKRDELGHHLIQASFELGIPVLKDGKRVSAVVLGFPAKATIKEANSESFVVKTLDRKTLWEMQTPQVIKPDLLKKGFELVNSSLPQNLGADISSVCMEAGMYAIRARRKTVTEKTFWMPSTKSSKAIRNSVQHLSIWFTIDQCVGPQNHGQFSRFTGPNVLF